MDHSLRQNSRIFPKKLPRKPTCIKNSLHKLGAFWGARECQEKKNLPGGALARSISKGTKM